MAEKLLQYYKYMKDEQGLVGQIELAKLTKLPGPKAALAPDSSDNITLFKSAVETITKKPAPKF
jgi:hypothetical protein